MTNETPLAEQACITQECHYKHSGGCKFEREPSVKCAQTEYYKLQHTKYNEVLYRTSSRARKTTNYERC
jgi:hypothetical protein